MSTVKQEHSNFLKQVEKPDELIGLNEDFVSIQSTGSQTGPNNQEPWASEFLAHKIDSETNINEDPEFNQISITINDEENAKIPEAPSQQEVFFYLSVL